jgi:hypothetical protein
MLGYLKNRKEKLELDYMSFDKAACKAEPSSTAGG